MRAATLALLALLAGCGPTAGETDDDPVSDTDTDSDTDSDTDATCDGEALCLRSIEQCDVDLTLETCVAFYDEETTTCADIGAYTSCNCDCIEEPTCDGYFACGQVCFSVHCE